jgi:hypothetical protein
VLHRDAGGRERKKVEQQFEIREGGEYERKLKETVD